MILDDAVEVQEDKMTKTFTVALSWTMQCTFEIDADDQKDAIDKAIDFVDLRADGEWDGENLHCDYVREWED